MVGRWDALLLLDLLTNILIQYHLSLFFESQSYPSHSRIIIVVHITNRNIPQNPNYYYYHLTQINIILTKGKKEIILNRIKLGFCKQHLKFVNVSNKNKRKLMLTCKEIKWGNLKEYHMLRFFFSLSRLFFFDQTVMCQFKYIELHAVTWRPCTFYFYARLYLI